MRMLPARAVAIVSLLGLSALFTFGGSGMAHAGGANRIEGKIVNETDMPLTIVQYNKEGEPETRAAYPPPSEVGKNATTEFARIVGGAYGIDAMMHFIYRIGNTPYQVKGYVKVPFLGKNQKSCEIVNLSSSPVGEISDYACSMEWGSDNEMDPRPVMKVMKKPVEEVTSPSRQLEMLRRLCAKGPGPGCRYSASKPVETFVTAEHPVSKVVKNCRDQEQMLSVGWSTSQSASTTISGSTSLDISFLKSIIQLNVSAEISHTWEVLEEKSSTIQVPMKPHEVVQLFAQDEYDEVTGDFTLNGDNNIYSIKAATFTFPIKDGGAIATYTVGKCGNDREDFTPIPKVLRSEPTPKAMLR